MGESTRDECVNIVIIFLSLTPLLPPPPPLSPYPALFTVIDDNGGTTGGAGHTDAAIPAADGCAAAIHAADDGGTKQGMKGRRH